MWKDEPVNDIKERYYFQREYTGENNDEDYFNSPQDFYIISYAEFGLMWDEDFVLTIICKYKNTSK